jgi:structural maintenance of chromosome 4
MAYDGVKAEVDAIRSAEIDLAARIEDVRRKVGEWDGKRLQWTKKLEQCVREINNNIELMQSVAVPTESDEADAEPASASSSSSPSSSPSSSSSSSPAPAPADVDAKAMDVEEEEEKEEKQPEGLMPYTELTADQIGALRVPTLEQEIARGEADLADLKPNMHAIKEYRAKEREYGQRVSQLDTVTSSRDAARTSYESLRKQRLDEFMSGFSIITMKLKEMYQMLTLGGDAELELVDSLDPFNEGIVFSVRPPKKSWKNIQNLSGGEKTLSSLALVFALHHFKPTPLYVMDEIDAALDFKNVSIVANYIKERTKNAQFIIISLRNNMFELADRLVGIYKTDDVTKSLTVDPKMLSAKPVNAQQSQSAAKQPVKTMAAVEPQQENVEQAA